jgi:hypothetical protein
MLDTKESPRKNPPPHQNIQKESSGTDTIPAERLIQLLELVMIRYGHKLHYGISGKIPETLP